MKGNGMREAKSTTDGSNQESDRRAVVFGASGFIGSHVVEELCSAGHKVTAVLRSESSRSMLEYFGAQVRVLDYGNRSELRSVIEGQDVVFNCLATTAGGEKDKEPEVEFRLTRVLAETAATLHARHFVQLSSIVLYGFERSGIIDESYRPSVSYRAQEVQLRREEIVKEVFGDSDTGLTVLRPASVIGSRGERSFFARMYALNQSGRFPIVGDGQATSSFIDARDLGKAMALIAEHRIVGTYLVKGFDASWLSIKQTMDDLVGRRTGYAAIPAHLTSAELEEASINPYEYLTFCTTRIWDDSRLRQRGYMPLHSLEEASREEINYLTRHMTDWVPAAGLPDLP